ncbi:MAG: hypothetical protein ACI9WC_000227 [Arenicella sp.]
MINVSDKAQSNLYTQALPARNIDNPRIRSIPSLRQNQSINTLPRLVKYSLLVFIFVAGVGTIQAQSNLLSDTAALDWQLKRERRGIKVYIAPVMGSKYRAIKSSVLINASLVSIIGLIKDSASCSKWADMCKHSEVYQTVSDTENYVYTYNDLPFPIKDRDILAHVQWTIDPKNKVLSMHSSATTGLKEINPKAVRLTQAIAKWQFTLQADGSVLVENYAHVDPNGPIPAWISNRLMISSPYKTLLNMRRLAESGAYDNHLMSLPDF